LIVYEVWHLRSALSDQLDSSTALIEATLTTSDQTLVVLDRQLQSVAALASTGESAAQTTAATIRDTHQALQSASQLLHSNLPAALSTAHQAVVSAEGAATLIDNILGGLSLIPGFSSSYHPQVPLHVALANVAQSLDQLPALTRTLAADLDAANNSLPTAQTDVTSVAQTLRASPIDADAMRSNVAAYRAEVAQLQSQIESLRSTANAVITWTAVAVTFLTLWLAIAQALLVYGGIWWLRR
jgi:predicted  nucleic acid-binding Zn-ribbon protein